MSRDWRRRFSFWYCHIILGNAPGLFFMIDGTGLWEDSSFGFLELAVVVGGWVSVAPGVVSLFCQRCLFLGQGFG